MANLEEMRFFSLGMEVYQVRDGIFISQRKYAVTILKKFHMENRKPISMPLVVNEKLSRYDNTENGEVDASSFRSLVESLLYLTATCHDLMYSISLLSRYM